MSDPELSCPPRKASFAGLQHCSRPRRHSPQQPALLQLGVCVQLHRQQLQLDVCSACLHGRLVPSWDPCCSRSALARADLQMRLMLNSLKQPKDTVHAVGLGRGDTKHLGCCHNARSSVAASVSFCNHIQVLTRRFVATTSKKPNTNKGGALNLRSNNWCIQRWQAIRVCVKACLDVVMLGCSFETKPCKQPGKCYCICWLWALSNKKKTPWRHC